MDVIHMPWLNRRLTVLASSDPSLVGIFGTVLNETRRTVTIQNGEREKMIAKNVIKFQIDGEPAIDGRRVCQRPEDRIHRSRRQ
jgi:RNase P/RNase MRP subunit p29